MVELNLSSSKILNFAWKGQYFAGQLYIKLSWSLNYFYVNSGQWKMVENSDFYIKGLAFQGWQCSGLTRALTYFLINTTARKLVKKSNFRINGDEFSFWAALIRTHLIIKRSMSLEPNLSSTESQIIALGKHTLDSCRVNLITQLFLRWSSLN